MIPSPGLPGPDSFASIPSYEGPCLRKPGVLPHGTLPQNLYHQGLLAWIQRRISGVGATFGCVGREAAAAQDGPAPDVPQNRSAPGASQRCGAAAVTYAPRDDRRGTRTATITDSWTGSTLVVTVAGSLEWDTTSELTTRLKGAEDADSLIVDLSGILWADSALLQALIDLQRHLRRHDTALILRGPLHPVPRRLFELTGTADYFTFDGGWT
nr:STAS domain-containing protein [Streptomyces sp. SID14478]